MTYRTLSADDIFGYFNRASIGAESLFDNVVSKTQSYPPYNIVQRSADDYEITLAVAGFSREELEVSVDAKELTIKSVKVEKEEETKTEEKSEYPLTHYQGIAKRDFTRSFKLMEYLVVQGVSYVDGLLTVRLKRELPEALKPRTISID